MKKKRTVGTWCGASQSASTKITGKFPMGVNKDRISPSIWMEWGDVLPRCYVSHREELGLQQNGV